MKEAGGLGGLRNEQPHRTRAGETEFRLTGWTDFTIFQVLTGGGGLSQLPDPSEMHQQEAASCHYPHTLTMYLVPPSQQAGGRKQDFRGKSDAPLTSRGLGRAGGCDTNTNNDFQWGRSPNKVMKKKSQILRWETRTLCTTRAPQKQKNKNNQVGERLGFKEGRRWLVTPNRF